MDSYVQIVSKVLFEVSVTFFFA